MDQNKLPKIHDWTFLDFLQDLKGESCGISVPDFDLIILNLRPQNPLFLKRLAQCGLSSTFCVRSKCNFDVLISKDCNMR